MQNHIFSLEGKTALVTGGSKGLGLATVRQLERLGANVTLVARNELEVAKAALETGARGLVGDVSSVQGVADLLERCGRMDILVSNAGGPTPGKALEMSEADWYKGFELTFMSTVRLAQGLMPHMQAQGWGRVIAITSMTVERPNPNIAVSNALRAAVTNYLRTLALEVAPHGVTVNAVAPGYFATERLNSLYSPEQKENLLSSIPMSRIGDPDEFGAVVAFLASSASSYITGQALQVNGGFGIK